MKKLLIISLLLSRFAISQNSFTTDYLLDSLKYSTAANIKSTPDSGFVVYMKIGGNSGSYGPLIVKFDKTGKKRWSRYIDHLVTSPADILPVKDNFFITGYTGDDMFQLIKLDPNGNVLWRKLYTYGKQSFSVHAIDETHLLIHGVYESPPFGDPVVTVLKVDTAGNIGWARQYNYTYSYGRGISLKDKSIVAFTQDGFINIDTTGAVRWITKPSLYTSLTAGIGTDDGIIFPTYLTGDTNIVYKIDNSGLLQWTSKKMKIRVNNLIENNGNFIACGGYFENGKNRAASLAEINNSGEITKQIKFNSDSAIISAKIAKTTGDKFAMLIMFNDKFRIIFADDPFALCDSLNVKPGTGTLGLTLNPASVSPTSVTFSRVSSNGVSIDWPTVKNFIGCCPSPDANFLASPISGRIPLNVTFSNGTNNMILKWDFGDGTFSEANNPVHEFKEQGNYIIKLITETGDCIDSAFVEVIAEDPFLIRNVFTPNNDGNNDLFEINNPPEGSVIKIYDRWGLSVFETKNISESWNGKNASGKECSEGVYYYLFTLPDNSTRKGFVHLLR